MKSFFTSGLFGVPAPFIVGGGWMLVTSILFNTLLTVSGPVGLLLSFGIGAVIVIGGFAYGLYLEKQADKAKATSSLGAGKF